MLSLFTEAQSLQIGTGASFVLNGPVTLVLNDAGLINAGNFVPDKSSVKFAGALTGSSFIGGSTTTINFYNVVINKSANDVLLNSNIQVANSITMSGGNLLLNNHNLDIDGNSPGIIGESEISRITGTNGGLVRITTLLNAPVAVNPGNIGIEITSSTNLGMTTITRGHVQQTSANGGLSILRYYDISPAVNTGLNATVRFYYFNAELAGRNEPELNLWSSSDGGSTWSLKGRDAVDATINWVEKSNIDQFSRLTLASTINNPLPITLLYFRGMMVSNQARLYWVTEQEFNNDHFELERSGNGAAFNQLATIKSHGNSNTKQEYEHIDPLPMNGVNYYRLKQVDKDQHFTYSNIVILNTRSNTNALVKLYPLPARDKLTIVLISDKEKDCTLSLYDQLGHLVESKKVHYREGINTIEWNVSSYSAGTYYILFDNLGVKSAKIIKE